MKSITTFIGFVFMSLSALGQSVSITSDEMLKFQSEGNQLLHKDLMVIAPVETNKDVPETLLSKINAEPQAERQSADAHIYLAPDGIRLNSDGTIAGIQFEITNLASVEMTLELEGFELIQFNDGGTLRAMIFNENNTPIPSGMVLLASFNQEAGTEAEWSSALAGNRNTSQVPLVFHYGNLEMHTVTFDITDDSGNPVTNAIITFDGITFDAGHYIIEDVEAGEYDYKVEKTGFHSVEETVDISEDTTINVILDIDVGIVSTEDTSISVYPVPANVSLFISSDVLINEIMVLDMLGQVLYQASVKDNNHMIQVSDFETGIYLLQFTTKKGMATKKIQVTR